MCDRDDQYVYDRRLLALAETLERVDLDSFYYFTLQDHVIRGPQLEDDWRRPPVEGKKACPLSWALTLRRFAQDLPIVASYTKGPLQAAHFLFQLSERSAKALFLGCTLTDFNGYRLLLPHAKPDASPQEVAGRLRRYVDLRKTFPVM